MIGIQTLPEWHQTGVVDGAVALEFFDIQGQCDAQAFISSVEKLASYGSRIRINCLTASDPT